MHEYLRRMKPAKDIQVQKLRVGKIPVLVLRPKVPQEKTPALLWIHGGGLTAALCMLARDRGTVKIAYQFPLYPMLSNLDTDSSRDNHGRVWNTKRNHLGWRFYLRGNAKKKVSPYASPIHRKDFSDLPPAYTFVGNGEPFYAETLEYVRKLKEANIEAEVDVYPSDMHAFDMLDPESEVSQQAIRTFEEKFEKALMRIQNEDQKQ